MLLDAKFYIIVLTRLIKNLMMFMFYDSLLFMIMSLLRGSLYKILHRPNCLIDEKRRIKMALDVVWMNLTYLIDMFFYLFLLIQMTIFS